MDWGSADNHCGGEITSGRRRRKQDKITQGTDCKTKAELNSKNTGNSDVFSESSSMAKAMMPRLTKTVNSVNIKYIH